MVILEVNLDEGLPVVIALVDLDFVEFVAREVEVATDLHAGQICIRGTGTLEEQALPVLELLTLQIEAGILGEMRSTDEQTIGVVSPAMDWADDVSVSLAGTLQHDGLTMTADVGHLVVPIIPVDQQLRVVQPFERAVLIDFRHHEFVADVARTGIEEETLLQLENPVVEVPRDRQLGNCR